MASMAGKKRDSSSISESDNQSTEKSVSEPSKKKSKSKTEEPETINAQIDASSLPMERRKIRKALDKQRRFEALENPHKPKEIVRSDKAREVVSASERSVLPEFHIGVFKDLAVADAPVREAAVEALATELRDIQEAYDKIEDKNAIGGGLKLEAEKDDGLKNCAPSVQYAVRRLIRGVSSSRECARQGFALGLTLLIGTIPCIKMEALLKLIVDLLEISSSMKGQDVRDCLLGRLFSYGAIARSGRLTEEWISDKTTTHIKEFTSLVISLAAKKRYLQEPAVSVILDLVDRLPTEAVSQVLEAPGLQEWFETATEVGNPDALLLALKLQEKTSTNNVFTKLLTDPFTPSKFFASDHMSSLVNCFKESTFCQPRVHSVWPVLVNILLPDTIPAEEEAAASGSNSIKKSKKSRKGNASEEDTLKSIHSFVEIIIEGSLLMSSHDRKHLALDVVLLLLPKLPASCVSIVLSEKLIQCLMDVLSTKDSWLYKVAEHFVKELSDWVSHDDVRRVVVIMALQKHSNGRFDSITRTKTVKDMLGEFKSESGCMLLIHNLMNMFVDEGQASDEPSDQSQTTDDNSELGSIEDKGSPGATGSSETLKSWIMESLPSILKHLKLDPEAKFRVQMEILKFLAVQGVFSASLGTEVTSFELQEKFKWPKAAISSALCRMCIEQLQQLLSSAQKGEGPHAVTDSLETSDVGSYFMRFLSTLCNIPSVSFFRPLSDEDEKAFKKLQAMETRLCREEKNCALLSVATNKLHAFRYLLIQLLLQILLRPGEFSEAAAELIICCNKAFAAADLLDSSGEDEVDDDGTPELMDVLVDTLLSLLPQSSAPMRSAIEQVFRCFCNDVTDDGLLRMLRVIKKDLKPARHRKDSEDNDDDDGDEDFLDIEEAEESDEGETGETGESDEHTDDSELVAGGGAVDKEHAEDSDESDGGMDDDAMFRMDSYIAQMFKERKNMAGGESAHSQLVLFKLRVLSLLEIYLHENPDKPQVLIVYSNLTQAYVNPNTAEGSDQLGQRIWGILQKKIFKAKEYPKGEGVQLSTLESLLEKHLRWASKPFKKKKYTVNPSKKKQSVSLNRHKMITTLAQNSAHWILKIIDARKFSESELKKVFDIFQSALESYFDSKKTQMKSAFLREIFRRRPWIGHKHLGILLEKCGGGKLEFRRVEALELVGEILKSLISDNTDQEEAKKVFRNHLPKFCYLIEELLKNMPGKQSRRAEVRKFCGKVFQIASTLGLTKSFLKALSPEAHAACESQLGESFLAMKKSEK